MTPVFAHVLGMPLEEGLAQILPVGIALMAAIRMSLRRVVARKPGNSIKGDS